MDYELLKRIASGSWGEVWEARDPRLEKSGVGTIALKMSRAQAQDVAFSPIRWAAGLEHQSLIALYLISNYVGRVCIAMEMADDTLWDLVHRAKGDRAPTGNERTGNERTGNERTGNARSPVLCLFQETAEAIDYLHSKNLCHNGVTPFEILIKGGRAKLADFDLLTPAGESLPNGSPIGLSTWCCMAPEVRNGRSHPHSDQYSLAISYVWLRLDALPLNPVEADKVRLESFPDGEREVLLTALAPNPAHRFQSCVAFVDAIKAVMLREERPP